MDNQTLNETGVNQEVGGIVNPDSPRMDPDSASTFHDLDDREDPKESKEASSAADDKAPVDDEAAKAKGQDARYDKDPAWQRIKEERNEARKQAEEARVEKARLEGIITASKPASSPAPTPLPFKDINLLTAEQLREWQEDDPKGYAQNLKAQAQFEAEYRVTTAMNMKATRDRDKGMLEKTYNAFEEKNPEFRKMWDTGEIIKFIESNPGHNPISAYHEMTFEKRQTAAIAEAVKKAEEEITKRFQSKKRATVITEGGTSAPRGDMDPALANTKQHGGLNAVLADKLAALRRAGGR